MARETVLTVLLFTELYTDESPGLKVDPVVVLVLSVGFIISVVALHGMFLIPHTLAFARGRNCRESVANETLSLCRSHRQNLPEILFIRCRSKRDEMEYVYIESLEMC